MPKQAAVSVHDPLILLARQAVNCFIREAEIVAVPDPLPVEQREPYGIYVSLIKAGKLRGCVGHVRPKQSSLAKEVIYTAIAAAVNDPRFSPVMIDELEQLSYVVDVVEHLALLKNIDAHDPNIAGLRVVRGRNQGVVLPNASGITTFEQQRQLAYQRAQLTLDTPATLERFQVRRIIELSGNYQLTVS
ncbi:AMMECR1 domain-containing protein [Herpetosiphon sp. NSE202]|uniref:AMMECR1 domain-containing protein n=1 Tax=Herpetosiphon sp. NSE202 TaxID=3351349 RepID=UPI003644BF14